MLFKLKTKIKKIKIITFSRYNVKIQIKVNVSKIMKNIPILYNSTSY